MSPSESLSILNLLYCVLGMLAILLGLAFWILRRLFHIRSMLMEFRERHDDRDNALSTVEGSAGGAFEMFLSEDPSRAKLPKGEQFAEYRKWRQEKGLNWSNS